SGASARKKPLRTVWGMSPESIRGLLSATPTPDPVRDSRTLFEVLPNGQHGACLSESQPRAGLAQAVRTKQAAMTTEPSPPIRTCSATGVLLGDRLATSGLEPDGVIGTTPLVLRAGAGGQAVLFRYGVVVFFDAEPT